MSSPTSQATKWTGPAASARASVSMAASTSRGTPASCSAPTSNAANRRGPSVVVTVTPLPASNGAKTSAASAAGDAPSSTVLTPTPRGSDQSR